MVLSKNDVDRKSAPGSAGVSPVPLDQTIGLSPPESADVSPPPSPPEQSQADRSSTIVRPWRSRRYLPHFDNGASAQSLTFRLADSLPGHVLARLERELATMPSTQIAQVRRKRLEAWLDRGKGAAWLAEPQIADLVAGAIGYLEGRKYDLHAWVVMPNHVHLLISPLNNVSIASIAHALKSFTAKEANRHLARTGPFWQREYFDRAIRNLDHFLAERAYIEANPVKAGLCKRNEDWPFGSAQTLGESAGG